MCFSAMNRVVSVALFILLVLCSGCGARGKSSFVPGREDRLGVCTHFNQGWDTEKIMPVIGRLGVGWIRDDVSWKAVEPQKGRYRIPDSTRNWIEAARRQNLKVLVVFNYGNPNYPDLFDSGAYARAAAWFAGKLRGKIDAIEVLNEPNNFGFRKHYGGAWNGKEKDGSDSPYLAKYVALLNQASQAIKKANPDIEIIGLGAPAPATFRMLAAGIAPEVDGMTDHPYSHGAPERIPYAATPAMLNRDGVATADEKGTFASQVAMFRARSKEYHGPAELWHTEWGYSLAPSPASRKGMSEETQANYIMRRIVESFALRVEHSFIYDFLDDGSDPRKEYANYGLAKRNLKPKASYIAVQRLLVLLKDQQPVASERTADAVRIERFYDAARGRMLVAFWRETEKGNTTPMDLLVPSKKPVRTAGLYNPLKGVMEPARFEQKPDGVIARNLLPDSTPKVVVIDYR
jgi:hypothetical protein